jgi:hypothetical protein
MRDREAEQARVRKKLDEYGHVDDSIAREQQSKREEFLMKSDYQRLARMP